MTLPDGVVQFMIARRLFLPVLGGCLWLAWAISLAMGRGQFDSAGQLVGVDHLTFYSTARLLRDGRGEEIYDLARLSEYQQSLAGPGWDSLEALRAPPFAILPYLPTTGVSYLASFWIWTGVSLLALLGSVWVVWPERRWKAIGWSLAFYPTFATITFGQNTLISLAVFTLVSLLWSRRRPYGAGLAASILFCKPQLLTGLVIWWLLSGRRGLKPLAGLATGGAGLALLSFLVLRDVTTLYLSQLKTLLAYDQFDLWNMHNFRAFGMMLLNLSPGSGRLLGMAILIAGAVGWAVIAWRQSPADADSAELNMARAIGFSLLFSPHAMIYEWALVLLPAALMFRSPLGRNPQFVASCLLACAVLCVSTPIAKLMFKVSPHMLQVSVPVLAWIGWRWLVRDVGWASDGAIGARDAGNIAA